MKKSNNWQVPKALGAIKDKRAVGPLIRKLKRSNFSPMREVVIEALGLITGHSTGDWQQWWRKNGPFYTPENTIKTFMAAAIKLDMKNAMVCVAPKSHDYEDIKKIFQTPEHPFNSMFRKIAPSVPVKIIEVSITDTMCVAVWQVTLKEDFTVEGKTFKAGETFDLDGNLHKYNDRWLITGI
jgi:hypothetical protein